MMAVFVTNSVQPFIPSSDDCCVRLGQGSFPEPFKLEDIISSSGFQIVNRNTIFDCYPRLC